MKLTVTFCNEGTPETGRPCLVILRGEILRAHWSGLCWIAEGRPNFIAPDWWAELPEETLKKRNG